MGHSGIMVFQMCYSSDIGTANMAAMTDILKHIFHSFPKPLGCLINLTWDPSIYPVLVLFLYTILDEINQGDTIQKSKIRLHHTKKNIQDQSNPFDSAFRNYINHAQ